MCKMEDLSVISSLPLSSLDSSTRTLLSNLLDSTKVLLTEEHRYRDWRGLASLVNISSELESTIWNYKDKTGKVLDLWMQNRAGKVGELLEHLTVLDRFDVYDDIIASIKEYQSKQGNQVAILSNKQNQHINNNLTTEDYEITFEDLPGQPHYYHAYVLYAEKDQEFVMQLKTFLNGHGFEICMKDNLLPGFASQFPPVAKLITERCKRIILVYSAEFLQCHDCSFFRDYAQALSVQTAQRLLLPIKYKNCVLPFHLSIYHSLYYDGGSQIFWNRLRMSMEGTRFTSINAARASQTAPRQQNSNSVVDIQTMSASVAPTSDSHFFLPYKPPKDNLLTPGNVSLALSNVSPAVSNVSLAPSNVSLAPSLALSTVSLPQNLPSQKTNSTNILKKKFGNFTKIFKLKKEKKNKKKMAVAMTPSRAEQLCA